MTGTCWGRASRFDWLLRTDHHAGCQKEHAPAAIHRKNRWMEHPSAPGRGRPAAAAASKRQAQMPEDRNASRWEPFVVGNFVGCGRPNRNVGASVRHNPPFGTRAVAIPSPQ